MWVYISRSLDNDRNRLGMTFRGFVRGRLVIGVIQVGRK
jgi:hypothetical protein